MKAQNGAKNTRNRDRRRGGAMVEFALVLPLLFLLCMGATDFGRLFFHAVTVANAAGTGAFYGSQSNVKSGDFEGMQQAAEDDAHNLDEVNVTADRFCDCPDNPAVDSDGDGVMENTVSCTTGDCGSYGLPRVFVRAQVRQTFETVGPYPGIPDSTEVGRNGFMRVQ